MLIYVCTKKCSDWCMEPTNYPIDQATDRLRDGHESPCGIKKFRARIIMVYKIMNFGLRTDMLFCLLMFGRFLIQAHTFYNPINQSKTHTHTHEHTFSPFLSLSLQISEQAMHTSPPPLHSSHHSITSRGLPKYCPLGKKGTNVLTKSSH